jgi:hypothetical protein
MDIYRIPRREVCVKLLLIDGRHLDGTIFTSEIGSDGLPEQVLQHLNDPGEDFVPLVCGGEAFLLNKAGILWVQLAAALEGDGIENDALAVRIPTRLTLAGGLSVAGTLAIVMPPERSRAVDFLNAAGRFLPVHGDGTVTLVQRRFVVTVHGG